MRGGRVLDHVGNGAPSRAAALLLSESDRWFLWIPVLFGAGIALYFSLADEPSPVIPLSGIAIALMLLWPGRSRPLLWAGAGALACLLAGFAAAQYRTGSVEAPRLTRNSGAAEVTGWVERSEPRGEASHRLTLRVISISARHPMPDLYRVRITSRFANPPPAGTAVTLRAVLRPPPEPAMPGGFDHARKAWFERVGASGWAISAPVAATHASEPPLALRALAAVDRLRMAVQSRIDEALPASSGAIANALIAGEKGRIPEDELKALRNSGLAHILAISGMHMALFAGSLFWAIRAALAAVPAIALRIAVKKPAAITAFLGGAGYLLLSGAGVATQRAFLMMSIVVLSVLLDRPAITLRNVAIAAMILLVARPEALFDVSFQMSFAAATALVAVYQAATADRREGGLPLLRFSGLSGRIFAYFAGIALSTLVAGLAVAPFSAYHFHNIAQYSLLGNLLSLPVFGIVVMPMVLAALLLMPLGLDALPFLIMGKGIEAILAIAAWVASLDGAVLRVAAMPGVSLALMALGGLWLCLWRSRIRCVGLVIAAMGLLAMPLRQAPDMLISQDGRLAAIRAEGDRFAITGATRPSYNLEQWLQADGDGREAADALKSQGMTCDEHACLAMLKGKSVALLRHPGALDEECARSDIVIAPFPVGRRCGKTRVVIDQKLLSRSGTHALFLDGQSIRVESVADLRGRRPWVRQPAPYTPAQTGSAIAGEDGAQ
ncbi:MAG: ComEC/Rec2 family competence protein [Pseudomonadota bacterium]|nr:ComEC/Rec2 family competence protein [Pseudomonadota bacterium]